MIAQNGRRGNSRAAENRARKQKNSHPGGWLFYAGYLPAFVSVAPVIFFMNHGLAGGSGKGTGT